MVRHYGDQDYLYLARSGSRVEDIGDVLSCKLSLESN